MWERNQFCGNSRNRQCLDPLSAAISRVLPRRILPHRRARLWRAHCMRPGAHSCLWAVSGVCLPTGPNVQPLTRSGENCVRVRERLNSALFCNLCALTPCCATPLRSLLSSWTSRALAATTSARPRLGSPGSSLETAGVFARHGAWHLSLRMAKQAVAGSWRALCKCRSSPHSHPCLDAAHTHTGGQKRRR